MHRSRTEAFVRSVDFEPHHLDGVLRLHQEEGWPSLPEDPERALRALTAPGVRAVVALNDGVVRGFARALTDGQISACLTDLVVDRSSRLRGIGRALVEQIFQRCGTWRIDLLSEDDSQDFYRTISHREKPGFRIYR